MRKQNLLDDMAVQIRVQKKWLLSNQEQIVSEAKQKIVMRSFIQLHMLLIMKEITQMVFI